LDKIGGHAGPFLLERLVFSATKILGILIAERIGLKREPVTEMPSRKHERTKSRRKEVESTVNRQEEQSHCFLSPFSESFRTFALSSFRD
jgi:hypothetical protein